MTVKTFRKKPVEIQAAQFLGRTGNEGAAHDVYLWVEKHIGSVDPSDAEPGVTIDPVDGHMVIRTLEGDMKVSRGDWVIRGVQGEFYPCKPDIFEATYEPVSD